MVRIIRSLSSSSNLLLCDLDLKRRGSGGQTHVGQRKETLNLQPRRRPNSPFSPLEVVLTHWHILEKATDHSEICLVVQVCVLYALH